jgi:hypothetical protein
MKIGNWYANQIDRAQIEPGFKIKDYAHRWPINWSFFETGKWSIGITYLVTLSYDEQATNGKIVNVYWRNPAHAYKMALISREVVKRFRQEREQTEIINRYLEERKWTLYDAISEQEQKIKLIEDEIATYEPLSGMKAEAYKKLRIERSNKRWLQGRVSELQMMVDWYSEM